MTPSASRVGRSQRFRRRSLAAQAVQILHLVAVDTGEDLVLELLRAARSAHPPPGNRRRSPRRSGHRRDSRHSRREAAARPWRCAGAPARNCRRSAPGRSGRSPRRRTATAVRCRPSAVEHAHDDEGVVFDSTSHFGRWSVSTTSSSASGWRPKAAPMPRIASMSARPEQSIQTSGHASRTASASSSDTRWLSSLSAVADAEHAEDGLAACGSATSSPGGAPMADRLTFSRRFDRFRLNPGILAIPPRLSSASSRGPFEGDAYGS